MALPRALLVGMCIVFALAGVGGSDGWAKEDVQGDPERGGPGVSHEGVVEGHTAFAVIELGSLG